MNKKFKIFYKNIVLNKTNQKNEFISLIINKSSLN